MTVVYIIIIWVPLHIIYYATLRPHLELDSFGLCIHRGFISQIITGQDSLRFVGQMLRNLCMYVSQSFETAFGLNLASLESPVP